MATSDKVGIVGQKYIKALWCLSFFVSPELCNGTFNPNPCRS
jgi:hypothetical protein